MTLLVYILGGGPIATIHVVYIQLSHKLHDLYATDLSGRSDGDSLSSGSDRAIGVPRDGAEAPQVKFNVMGVGYGTHSRHL